MNRIYNNVIEAIGNTPIVKLNKIAMGLIPDVYVKLEFTNPGGSIKDRIGWYLIEDAEKRGVLKPGGTLVEGTSGNTGVGLAIASAIKGYKCIFVLPDKMSQEKIKGLRAFGAKVVVTPTAVTADDPRSYYSVSRRLAKETPNAIYVDQYNNLANRECHYKTTGPEILGQMPDIDVFVAGMGTGGTICGTGKYLKEKKPGIQVVGIDPVGSILFDYFKTGTYDPNAAKTYKIEGIGEDFIPKNYDFSVIDEMVQVEDKESFLMTRELLLREGLFAGISSGSAVVGALKYIKAQGDKLKGKKILIVLPDSGNRYLSKAYDDDWMRETGFLESPSSGTAMDVLVRLGKKTEDLITCKPNDKISAAIRLMSEKGVSQIPVIEGGWVKGVVNESKVLMALAEGRLKPVDLVEAIMDASEEFVKPDTSIEKLTKMVSAGKIPLVTDHAGSGKILGIITKIDLLTYLGERG